MALAEEDCNYEVLSLQKLHTVATSLAYWVPECRLVPCESEHECDGYRCRCSFQCVWTQDGEMHYAIRRHQEPVLSDHFPIANRRIQKAMAALQAKLNHEKEEFPFIRQNLTSISFYSSWADRPDSDCLVTIHYDAAIQDPEAWKAEAIHVCSGLFLSQVTGRSRKRITRALDGGSPIIRDTLWLVSRNDSKEWRVSLRAPTRDDDVDCPVVRTVRYEKPEEAFFHPNATAMCHALEWMLRRLTLIIGHNINNHSNKGSCLLELYCGCGAHTVALMQTNLLQKIVAVELDERLVEACRRNVALNATTTTTSTTVNDDDDTDEERCGVTTAVEVVSADAGVWARREVLSAQSKNGRGCGSSSSFDILLVDPPRQGLDANVIRMAKLPHGSFRHFLYISCGRDALVRDLAILSSDFEVVDCTLVDLFPQTDAVESLVHLRRRGI